jgi:hypothetical protein
MENQSMPFKEPDPIEIDPLVEALTPEQVEKDAGEFERFLDGRVNAQACRHCAPPILPMPALGSGPHS